jgi:soluble cytochrome b562
MTTDGEGRDREKDRTEATFSALAAPAGNTPQSNPWKPAALLLLLMALGLPLAFGIRMSRQKLEFEDQVALAAEQVEQVRALAKEGKLTEAVGGLASVAAALSEVEGLVSATTAVRELAAARLDDLERERKRVAERDRRLDRCRESVDEFLAGDPEAAAKKARSGDTMGALERGLENLAIRLESFNVAAAAEGPGRVSVLEMLTGVWPMPGIEAEWRRAEALLARKWASASQLELAKKSLAEGKLDEAQAAVAEVLGEERRRELAGLIDGIRKARLLAEGSRLKESGDHLGAAALYRAAGNETAAGMETSLARKEADLSSRELLVTRLSEGLKAALDYRVKGAIAWVLARETGDTAREAEAARYFAQADLAKARSLRQEKDLHSALALARKASEQKAPGADELLKSITGELGRIEMKEKTELARSALALGAPAFAAFLMGERTPPPELLRDIKAARKVQALTEARAHFDQGNYAAARDAVAGLPADDVDVRTLSLLLVLTTDDGNSEVEMPKDAAKVRELLLRAVLYRARTDPAAAGRILAAHAKPDDFLPPLTAFLDAADLSEDKALWSALREEALRRVPLRKPEPSDEPIK